MKLNLLIIAVTLISIKVYSQNSNFSIDLHYPVPIDNNFVGENFNGIVGLGADYHFLEFDPAKVGISLNGGLLTDNNQSGPGNSTLVILQPRAVAELDLTSNGKIRPYIGIGYSFLFFKADGLDSNQEGVSRISDTESGLNINGGVSFNFTDRFFIKVQYDYIYLSPGEAQDIKFNTRVNIFKAGFGFRF
ncbi:outer membrane protein [Costertonia aggregata]|uniref:Porin family protein n=1 Tax=Costertonia aggregata TaxID=343403 RepID=A0A7H9ATW1_9FLAO|nr:OmpW family outer membrane protein [Costertonia aggregata]QLG46782.1 porin family protein [Costertonia aggregata]